MSAGGFSIERRQVLLDRPIKTLGLHELRIGLHGEVEPKVTINVARSEDEAARQARGEAVTGRAMDDAAEEAEAAAAPPKPCSRKAPLLPRKPLRKRPRPAKPSRPPSRKRGLVMPGLVPGIHVFAR